MRASSALLLLATTACVTRPRARSGLEARAALGVPEQVETVVRQAVQLDAAADRGADSLYAPEAVVIANARLRFAAPRLAAVGWGGRTTITGVTVTLEGRFAWALVDYRWSNLRQPQVEAGRASFVCEQRPKGWQIVHLHSSQVLPGDR